jgi:D-xylose transport system ATP-binding protein
METLTEPDAGVEADRAAPMPLLVARGVTKSFGPVHALTDVDFEVDRGEVVALVGDNGAGKSTLIKAIAGVQPADRGRFWVEGREVSLRSPQDASRLGIATVYQDLALCDNLDVVGNLYLGDELTVRGLPRLIGQLDERGMEHRTVELLAALGVTTVSSVRATAGSLSGGQRQSVAIARALVGSPRMLILDEPTAALGVVQTEQVLALVHELREQGLAIVVIRHNRDTVFDLADRIVVLRLGRREATFDRRTTSRAAVVAAIVGGVEPASALAVG